MVEEFVTTEAHWTGLTHHFASAAFERMAFGYCGESRSAYQRRHLLRELDLCDDHEYRRQNSAFVSLPASSAISRIVRAREHSTFVDVHSHPFAEMPVPSGTDQEGARQQARYLRDLAPRASLMRMIVAGSGHIWADTTSTSNFEWQPISRIRVLGAGGWRFVIPVNAPRDRIIATGSRHARTTAVLGDHSTAVLNKLRILVIGCGGTGSAVARLLCGYVAGITICDPDHIEIHNSPRLHLFAAGDEGRLKAEVAAREISRISPDCEVRALTESFPAAFSLEALKDADFVFCCPDHPAPRFAAAREAARFAVPLIEIGCGGRREGSAISALGYHVRLQVPGQRCLACNGLDLSQIEEPHTTEMKRRVGYLNDGSTIAGELMSLTTRAATDAVELFIRYVTGYAQPIPYNLYFDALNLKSLDISAAYSSRPGCTLCGVGAEIAGAGDHLGEDLCVLEPTGGQNAAV